MYRCREIDRDVHPYRNRKSEGIDRQRSHHLLKHTTRVLALVGCSAGGRCQGRGEGR